MSGRVKDRYARLAGRFWRHPKVLGLSDAALALWTRALSFQVDQMTDGAVSRALLKTLGHRDTKAADELVDAGLWERSPSGYAFHDYADHNLVTEKWMAYKERKAGNKRDSRAATAPPVTAPVTTDVTGDRPGDTPAGGAVSSRRRTQDAGRRTFSENDPTGVGVIDQVAREGDAASMSAKPLGRVLEGFRRRHNAKTATTGNPILSKHLERAREIGDEFAAQPDVLDASLDAYFASSDPFVLKVRWNFATWASDPHRWIPTRVEPQADLQRLMDDIPHGTAQPTTGGCVADDFGFNESRRAHG